MALLNNIQRKKINSIGVAILLCVNSLSWIFSIDNIIVIYAFSSLCIFIFNNNLLISTTRILRIGLPLLLLFLFSAIFAEVDKESFNLYFLSFLAFGFTGLLYSTASLDLDTFYKAIFLIALISIPGVIVVAGKNYASLQEATGHWMGISQGSLRLLLAIVLVIPLLKNRIFKIIAFATMLFYFNFYFNYGTRGAMLAFLVFVLLLFLEKRNWLKIGPFIIIGLGSLLLSFFFIEIVYILQNILDVLGINIRALDKILMLDEANAGMSNGRWGLWDDALKGFSSHPFIGNGVAAYEYKYGIYPHNFLLQILYEGGLVYFIPILLVFFKFFKILTSNEYSSQEKKFYIFLFSAGIAQLMFSDSYWRNVFFWYFIGVIVNAKPTLHKAKTL